MIRKVNGKVLFDIDFAKTLREKGNNNNRT
jgi:hypothetical protein